MAFRSDASKPGDSATVTDPGTRGFMVSASTVEPPQGSGALCGIAEEFAAKPATGTASSTVPIAPSPGRSGFGPASALAYDSGTGNGIYGMGWSLHSGENTRCTSRGLPSRDDETAVFQLSGSEDVVPLPADGEPHSGTTSAPGHTIHRYQPHTQAQFARIERWTRADGETHWRAISRDNISTIYGRYPESGITDPHNSAHVFGRMICERRDTKGNAIAYTYRADNAADAELAAAHDANRTYLTINRSPNRSRYSNRRHRTGRDNRPSRRTRIGFPVQATTALIDTLARTAERVHGTAVDSTTQEHGPAACAGNRGRRNLAAQARTGPHAVNITCVGDWRGYCHG